MAKLKDIFSVKTCNRAYQLA